MTTYVVEAYDKYGLQVLGNCHGQGFIHANNYKKTLAYKNLKTNHNNRIEQYKIFKLLGDESQKYNGQACELVETVWIQDLTN